MLLLLLACRRDAPPVDTAGRDTAGRDTADRDTAAPAAWEPPALACALVDPRPIDLATVPPAANLYGPTVIDVEVLASRFDAYGADWGCPTGTSGGGVDTWSGACATDGVTWEGRWTQTFAEDADGTVHLAEAGDAVRYTEAYDNVYDVAFDGISAYSRDPAGVETIARDFRLDLRGYDNPERDGAWNVATVERWVPGVSYTMDGRYDAAPADGGPPGEYCLYADARHDASCTAEPWGGWVLVGDATLVVTWDPAGVCDGCGAATLDGVPVGEVCDDFLAWVPPA